MYVVSILIHRNGKQASSPAAVFIARHVFILRPASILCYVSIDYLKTVELPRRILECMVCQVFQMLLFIDASQIELIDPQMFFKLY